MRPAKAILLAVAALVVLIGAARWGGTLTITNFLPLDKKPEVLVDRAQSILAELGYTEPAYSEPADSAWGLLQWSGIYHEIAAVDSSEVRWERLRDRPDAAAFWYRQSPQVLRPDPLYPPIFTRGAVQLMNPCPGIPGEAMVLLDLDGSLRRLEVLPKRFSTREPGEPDWAPLFAMANLDRARFTEDRPRYQRFMAPDLRRAWIGQPGRQSRGRTAGRSRRLRRPAGPVQRGHRGQPRKSGRRSRTGPAKRGSIHFQYPASRSSSCSWP